MFCDNSAINEMNPGMAGFLVAKKRMVELNGGMQQGIVYLLGAGPGARVDNRPRAGTAGNGGSAGI